MKTEDDAMSSRRQFVGGMTAGLAAALASPAFAQQGNGPRQRLLPEGHGAMEAAL